MCKLCVRRSLCSDDISNRNKKKIWRLTEEIEYHVNHSSDCNKSLITALIHKYVLKFCTYPLFLSFFHVSLRTYSYSRRDFFFLRFTLSLSSQNVSRQSLVVSRHAFTIYSSTTIVYAINVYELKSKRVMYRILSIALL